MDQKIEQAATAICQVIYPEAFARGASWADFPITTRDVMRNAAIAAARVHNLERNETREVLGVAAVDADMLAKAIWSRMCEIPDRNSPGDEPEACVCTFGEFSACVVNVLDDAHLLGSVRQQRTA